MIHRVSIKEGFYNIIPSAGFDLFVLQQLLPCIPMLTDGYKLSENEVVIILKTIKLIKKLGNYTTIRVIDFRPELPLISFTCNVPVKVLQYIQMTQFAYEYITIRQNLFIIKFL